MKMGAEPKKVAILAGLLAVAAVSAWINLGPATSPRDTQRAPRPAQTAARQTAPAIGGTTTDAASPRGGAVRRSAAPGGRAGGEFRPVFKAERRDAQVDPTTVDPGLDTSTLARLREVRLRGSGRNLFRFGEAPPPPAPPEPKIIPKPLGPDGRPIDESAAAMKPAEPTKPPPPPIPLRYYGFADPRMSTEKRAFFMEGEEIRIAGEGELIKQRYKVLEIGPRSAVVEDTHHDNKQTITLQAESGG